MDSDTISYNELGDIAERLFTVCEDDPICVATKLHSLLPDIRDQLLGSDLLNAFQAFYYFFREVPDIVTEEILLFHSAGHLVHGIPLIKGIGPFEMVFIVKEGIPVIAIIDEDDMVSMTFTGKTAYQKGLAYIREHSY